MCDSGCIISILDIIRLVKLITKSDWSVAGYNWAVMNGEEY